MKIRKNDMSNDYNFYINFDTIDVMYASIDKIEQFGKLVSRCVKARRLVLNDEILNWLIDNFGVSGSRKPNKITQSNNNNWSMDRYGHFNPDSVVLYMNEEVAAAFKLKWL